MEMTEMALHPRVTAAIAHIDASDAETVADMIAVTRIAAPSGAEGPRGVWLSERLRAQGLTVSPPDPVGNVIATRTGQDATLPPVILASHMDTVFAADTALDVMHHGPRICAPGISDNGRGQAALIRLASALHTAGIVTRHPIWFVGTVGEEGAGDLRGVKQLFSGDVTAAAFVAVDGAGIDRIVHRAVGSRRLRVSIDGPGGHSWIDRGSAHPIHALASALANAAALAQYPRSSFSAGRVEGGTGINVIPQQAWVEIDIRSEEGAETGRIETATRTAVATAVAGANAARRDGTAPLHYEITTIGDRPGGMTPVDADVVRHAVMATERCGIKPELVSSSTDANVPMSLGIPSIAVGAGGNAGGMHTTDEWFDNENGTAGIRRLLLLTLAVTGAVFD
ncbi:MAG: M20/M25/M40 family metallo-hydrolase [Longimicrobiales bacterium]